MHLIIITIIAIVKLNVMIVIVININTIITNTDINIHLFADVVILRGRSLPPILIPSMRIFDKALDCTQNSHLKSNSFSLITHLYCVYPLLSLTLLNKKELDREEVKERGSLFLWEQQHFLL